MKVWFRSLRHWIVPKWERLVGINHPDQEISRQGRLFNTLMLISIGIVISMTLIFVTVRARDLADFPFWIAAAFPIGFIPLSTFCIAQAKKGRVRAMATLYVWVNLVSTTIAILLFDGARSPGWLLFIWTISIAGVLLSPIYALSLSGGTLGYFLLLLLVEQVGLYTPPLSFGPQGREFLFLSFLFLFLISTVGLLTYLNMRSLHHTLGQLNLTADELKVRVEAEQRLRERLRASVQQYNELMDQVGNKNLSVRLDVGAHGHEADDPLVLLGHNLNHTVANLQHMIREIYGTAGELGSAAAKILSSTTQQAAGAGEQSAAVSQASNTIEEIRTIAEQTALKSQQVAEQAQQTAGVSQDGQQAVTEAIEGISCLKERVEAIADRIQALSAQTQAIHGIITTIDEIAAQSNLLALNAAVEAARAGTAGRGFAVVAGEVRSLAEQSQAATEQVRKILSDIQQGVAVAVTATREGALEAERGMQLAGKASRAIAELGIGVSASTQSAQQIAAAANQQQRGMEQITQAMGHINQVTAQSAVGARQIELAAEELNALAGRLHQLVEQYQL
jgi:methyl-accepting chemotaxis protein